MSLASSGLSSGDADNLLGLGTTQGNVLLIALSDNERVSPHVNLGFTVSGEGEAKRCTNSTQSA